MEFSSNVLIDFGLNLAGYLIAALLAYVLIGRADRTAHMEPAAGTIREAEPDEMNSLPPKPVAHSPKSDPEFLPLTDRARARPGAGRGDARPRHSSAVAGDEGGTDWRGRNRRAIYEEARRLLAGGTSPSDLLSRLPVTESELDMLTVTSKA